MMAYFDTEFNFLAANSSYAKGSGHALEDLIGKNHFELFPSMENQSIFKKVRDTAETVTFLDKPYEFVDQPERGITYWDWTLGPVKDEVGRVQGLILTLFETTRRKRTEEEAKALALLPGESPDPIMRISLDGIVLYCNQAGRPILDEWKCEVGRKVPSNWHHLVAETCRAGHRREFEEGYGSRWFSFVLAPIANAGYLNAYGRDITERKRMEDELLKAKNEWESTFNSMPDLISILDDKFRIVRANRSMAEHLGLTTSECIGLNCFQCVHKLDAPPSFCPFSRTMTDGREHFAEVHEENLGGDYMISTSPMFDESGRVTGTVHVARDITELKKAERELRASENRLRTTLDNMLEGCQIIGPDWRYLYINEVAARQGKSTKQKLLGRTMQEMYPGIEKTEVFATLERCMRDRTSTTMDTEFTFPDGDIGWFELSIQPVPEGLFILSMDVTETRRTERALRESQADLNRAQAVAKTGSWRLDVQHNVLQWSDETHRMFGITKGTPLTYESFLDIVHPDDRALVDQKWRAALRGEPYEIEHRAIVRGETKWVRELAELEFDEDGTLAGGFGTVQEITERKKMEQKLRESLGDARQREAEISGLLKAARAILHHWQFQPAAKSIFSCCKELVGATAGYVALLTKDGKQNEVLFLDPGGRECRADPSLPMPLRGLRAEAYKTGKVVLDNDFPESRWMELIPDGHIILDNVLFAPLVVGGKTVGVMGLANKPGGFHDNDSRMASAFSELASVALINSRNLENLEDNQKRLEEYSQRLEEMVEERTEKLREAQRLATIGETAGMVGHDIRNPLQSIEGAVYLMRDEINALQCSHEEKQDLSQTLEIVQNQIDYIDHVVADLQDFARTPKPEPRRTDMKKLATDALSMISIPANIEVETEFQEGTERPLVDPVHMKRVLLNLIQNAIQAMQNGGRLVIRILRDEMHMRIVVEDTGVGILEENKPKIFMPLFTTKSKGQGFGLSVCRRLVNSNNGDITFESRFGEGTTFTIKLPLAEKVD